MAYSHDGRSRWVLERIVQLGGFAAKSEIGDLARTQLHDSDREVRQVFGVARSMELNRILRWVSGGWRFGPLGQEALETMRRGEDFRRADEQFPAPKPNVRIFREDAR